MVLCAPRNHFAPKLGSQKLKTWKSHVTVGIVILEPVLTLGGWSLHCLPNCTLQHLAASHCWQIPRITAGEVSTGIIHHFHPGHITLAPWALFHSTISWGFQGPSVCLSACLVFGCKTTHLSSDEETIFFEYPPITSGNLIIYFFLSNWALALSAAYRPFILVVF